VAATVRVADGPAGEHHVDASNDPAAPVSSRRNRLPVYAALAVLMGFHLVNNLLWLQADNHLHRIDEGYHVKKASEVRVLLTSDEYSSGLARLVALLDFRSPYPPLSHVTGAVFSLLFGYTPDHVTLSCTFLFLLIILGVYAVSRQFLPPWPAFLAAFITSFLPLLYGLSRVFSQDYFSAAVVVWAIYALLRSDRFRHSGWIFIFALLLGLGFLAKQTTFAFLLFPSAFTLAAGLRRAHAPLRRLRFHPAVLRRLAFNAVLTVVVSSGVFTWWYVNHLEYLYDWWTTQRMYGEGFLGRAPAQLLGGMLPEVSLAQETVAGQAGNTVPEPPKVLLAPKAEAEAMPPPAPAATSDESWAADWWDLFFGAFQRHWYRYLLYLINDAVFLPTFLVGMMGLLALRRADQRHFGFLLTVVWVVGTYVAMTWLFKSKTPRYLLPMLPGFGILCAVALMQIRDPRWRRRAIGGFAALLFFQYANLTYASMGPLARVEIPVFRDNPAVRWTENHGITVWKDLIVTGVYLAHPPRRGANSGEHTLNAMAAYERANPRPGSSLAKYLVVSRQNAAPGLEMLERHYGPVENPYRPVDAGPEVIAPRYFEQVFPERRVPEQSVDAVHEVDYVVLKPGSDDLVDDRLMFWAEFYRPYGFESIAHFYEEGYGKYLPSWHHVLARRPAVTLDTAQNLFDLVELKNYPAESPFAVPQNLVPVLQQRLDAEIRRFPRPHRFSGELDLLTVQVAQTLPGWYQIRLAFIVRGQLHRNYRIYVHGQVAEEHADQVPPRFRDTRTVLWNFNPHPPTSEWKPGDIITLRRDVMAAPIPHDIVLGMFDNERGFYGFKISAGVVDFGALGQ
jgi:4-amino-4-deoxy-L-arabinose transferase-like glycosyltransferase